MLNNIKFFWRITKRILTGQRGTWVATAVIGSAVVGAGVGIYSSNNAADAQTSAANTASNTQLSMFQQGQAAVAPWATAGTNALATLVNKVNAGPGDYTQSPGYQFRLQQGEQAIENSAASNGMARSGATQKALTQYGQDYATNDYQNFLANYYNSLMPYQNMSASGASAATGTAQQGNQVASGIANNTLQAGQAQAAGDINAANAITGNMNSGINNYMLQQYLNSSGSGSGGVTPDISAGLGNAITGGNYQIADYVQ